MCTVSVYRQSDKIAVLNYPLIICRKLRSPCSDELCYEAIGTCLERRSFRSRVIKGTRCTTLGAAMISSAGSLSKSNDLIERQTSSVSGHV